MSTYKLVSYCTFNNIFIYNLVSQFLTIIFYKNFFEN